MSSNPNEYAARLLEAEAEKSSWMTLLPIFYYNETLFPGGRLDLHLFEPRYRVMMQRVVNSTRSFAYVANFNQYRAHVGDVALIAVLEEVEFMADGRCMLQAKLSSRMIIADHYGKNYCIFFILSFNQFYFISFSKLFLSLLLPLFFLFPILCSYFILFEIISSNGYLFIFVFYYCNLPNSIASYSLSAKVLLLLLLILLLLLLLLLL